MRSGTCYNGCADNFERVFWWTLLISQSVSAIWGAPLASVGARNSTTLEPAKSAESGSFNCVEEYWVENKAGVISIPRSNNSTPVVCRWLLKARDKRQTIALSTTYIEFNFGHAPVNFTLEARDGSGEDSPLLGSLRISNSSEFNLLTWKYVRPIKATSGFLLLTFQNEGYHPLLAKFVFYTCGGKFASVARIATPNFDDVAPPLRPQIIDCEWQLEKPMGSLYGYLRPVEVNVTDCTALQLYSNSTIRVLEHIGSNHSESGEQSAAENKLLASHNSTRQVLKTSVPGIYRNYSCGRPNCDVFVEQICGDSVRMIAFDSDMATLRCMSSSSIVFTAVYNTFKMPQHLDLAPKRRSWYLNYNALTIFTPAGVLIGLTIIWCQTRGRRPSQLRVEGKALSGNDPERSESFYSEVGKRVSQMSSEKPPAWRTMSLNTTNNNFPLDESTKHRQKKRISLLQNKSSSGAGVRTVDELLPCCEATRDETQLSKSSPAFASLRRSSKSCQSPRKDKKTRSVRFSTVSLMSDGLQTL